MKPVAPLSLNCKPSRRLMVALAFAHAVAVGAVLGAQLPGWLAALLLLLVGASLARARKRSAVVGLVLRGDGGLEAVGADGATTEAVVHPHTLVTSRLVVLVFRQQGRLRSLVLPADSLAAEDFRQLCLWLRWRSAAALAA